MRCAKKRCRHPGDEIAIVGTDGATYDLCVRCVQEITNKPGLWTENVVKGRHVPRDAHRN